MPQSALCPVCASGRVRNISADLYRCRSCGAAFNAGYRPSSYNSEYFLDEYKALYGKTYEEDFPQICRVSQQRLDKIFHFTGISPAKTGQATKPHAAAKELSLLDIGSALGFFLKCARDIGIGRLKGLEVSPFASDYCRKHFAIDVINAPFDDAALGEYFDIVTAWYFIEHLENPSAAIRRIYGMINPGGIFAFSSPSVFGPLFMCDRKKWIETHPGDHRINFSPGSAKKFLYDAGFKKVHVFPGGYHPERIVPSDSLLFNPFSGIYRIFASLTTFSDTIEAYAVK